MITEQVELAGEVGYYDVDDGEASFRVGANYYITPQVGCRVARPGFFGIYSVSSLG